MPAAPTSLLRRRSRALGLATSLSLAAATLAAAPAGATSTTLPASAIAANSTSAVLAIRAYLFCDSKACKSERAKEKASAQAGEETITRDVTEMKHDRIPTAEATIVTKYIRDADGLVSTANIYPKLTSAAEQGNAIGVIYYESANVAADAYLLKCAATGTPVAFAKWSVGFAGVIYAMQVATQEQTSTSSASVDANAQTLLLAEAASLRSDADGPSQAFNALLVQFAATQTAASNSALALLEHKAAKGTRAKVAALAKQLDTRYSALVALEKRLDK